MTRKAFTLIEMVIVILIAAILAAIAIAQAPNLPQLRLNLAANKLKSDIRFAQSYALATQQRTRIDFTTLANSYSIYRESSPGNWVILTNPLQKNNFTVALNQSDFSGVTISGVNFVAANYHLVFDASGIPYGYNPAGGATTALSSAGTVTLSGNGTRTISVEPQTGKVSIP